MEQPTTRPSPQGSPADEALEPVTVFLSFLDDEGGIYLGSSRTLAGARRVAEESGYSEAAASRTGAAIVWDDEPRVLTDGSRLWTGIIGHDYYSVRETTLS